MLLRSLYTRFAIERAFVVLKLQFHILHGEVRMRPERVCAIIADCFVLHYIALDYNEPEDEFHVENDDDLDVANNCCQKYRKCSAKLHYKHIFLTIISFIET